MTNQHKLLQASCSDCIYYDCTTSEESPCETCTVIEVYKRYSNNFNFRPKRRKLMNNQWIKCSDRLPEETELLDCDRSILIYEPNRDRIKVIEMCEIFHLMDRVNISHWMELPDRPEMEE